jgi:hypothetical protein
MAVADKFELLGHGNGWPSRGFIINSDPVRVSGQSPNSGDLPASFTSNSLNMGDAISVRPYVQPSAANGYDAVGFLRFRTLGGYSDSDSGNPTGEQLNLSLINAMKFFYNAKKGGSASATGGVGSGESENVSSSISPSVLENYTGGSDGTASFTGEVLSPKERVISFIKELNPNGTRQHLVRSNELFGNRENNSFSIPFSNTSAGATSGRYQVTIVRLFDTTDTNNPVFLGYGLQSHIVASGGGSFQVVSGTATSSIGSYFNPNSTVFNSEVDPGNVVVFDISDTDVSGMPLLTMNQSFTFDGADGNDTSSSATSSSATFALNGDDLTGSSSISPSYEFYTYS